MISWKSLANRLTRDPKIVIHGNSCIILYIFIANALEILQSGTEPSTWRLWRLADCDSRWVRSQNCGCLVTWFCYQLIAKPGNETAAVPWPDPDKTFRNGKVVILKILWLYIWPIHRITVQCLFCCWKVQLKYSQKKDILKLASKENFLQQNLSYTQMRKCRRHLE